MPKDTPWGLSWELPLSDGQIEYSTLTVSNGQDVLFNQYTGNDHKDQYTTQYKIDKDCTLIDITGCANDGRQNNHWDLKFTESCVDSKTATFKVTRTNGEILNLKPEGYTFENVALPYMFDGTIVEYATGTPPITLEWKSAPPAEVVNYEFQELELRPKKASLSDASSIIDAFKNVAVLSGGMLASILFF